MTVEEYAIKLIAGGAESRAEDGQIADELHDEACGLAISMVHAIRDNDREVFGAEMSVSAVEPIGPGELLHRADAVRVQGLPSSPQRYLVWFNAEVDVEVAS